MEQSTLGINSLEQDGNTAGISSPPQAGAKKPRKARKKKAQLIAEAFQAGRLEGQGEFSGQGLATLLVGVGVGAGSMLLYLAIYHAWHG
jgi:hypothetical protein